MDPKNIEELYVQIADTCYAVEEAASEENLKAVTEEATLALETESEERLHPRP